jgi:hypothetical protein
MFAGCISCNYTHIKRNRLFGKAMQKRSALKFDTYTSSANID